MNSSELQIYSYLMRNSIPFIRHCHSRCSSEKQLRKAVGENDGSVFIPKTEVLKNTLSGRYCLLVYDGENHAIENYEPEKFERLKDREDFFSVLKSDENTFSPLCLVLAENIQMEIVYDVMILRYKTVYLSPCSEKSTVSMDSYSFVEKFLRSLSGEIRAV